MSKDPQAYIVNTLKRKSVEVFEKNMDMETKEKFRKAKDTEIYKFLQSEALESLPKHLQPPKSEAMSMRWLLSCKVDGEGATVPKARLVILGYQNSLYEHRITYAPTTTRHTRQLMLQQAACRGWKCSFLLHSCKGESVQKNSFAYQLMTSASGWESLERASLA